MMASVSAVEAPRATVLVIATAPAVAVSVTVCRSTLVEPTRTAVAVAAIVRPAAAPRIEVEARTASVGHALDHGVATDQFGLTECEGSGIRRRREIKASSDHCGNSENLHAYHDLNLVSARHPLRPTGEIEGCTALAEPMLTQAWSLCSADVGVANRKCHA